MGTISAQKVTAIPSWKSARSQRRSRDRNSRQGILGQRGFASAGSCTHPDHALLRVCRRAADVTSAAAGARVSATGGAAHPLPERARAVRRVARAPNSPEQLLRPVPGERRDDPRHRRPDRRRAGVERRGSHRIRELATVQTTLHGTPDGGRLSAGAAHVSPRQAAGEGRSVQHGEPGGRGARGAGVDPGRVTRESVSREAWSLLTDKARVAQMREGLATVRACLGAPGASERAATRSSSSSRSRRL